MPADARSAGGSAAQSTCPAAATNLGMAVLGVGQLTLPYACSRHGLGLEGGLAAMAALTALALYSLWCLREGALRQKQGEGVADAEADLSMPLVADEQNLQARDRRAVRTTYAKILDEHLGKFYVGVCDIMLLVYAWGGAVSFLVVIKQQIHLIAHSILAHEHAEALAKLPAFVPMDVLTAAVVLPLALLRNIKALRYSSVGGSLAAIFITAVVIIHNPTLEKCKLAQERNLPPALPTNPLAALGALPLLAFALNTSWSFVPVFVSMSNEAECGTRRETARLRRLGSWLAALVHLLVLVDYAIIAVVGSITFCDDVPQNILDGYTSDVRGGEANWRAHMVLFARIALVLQLCFALPLRFHVARGVIIDERSATEWSLCLTTALLVVSAAAFASPPVGLKTTIGLTSAICASVVIYVLPARVHAAFAERPANAQLFIAGLVAAFGFVVLVGGSAGSVSGA